MKLPIHIGEIVRQVVDEILKVSPPASSPSDAESPETPRDGMSQSDREAFERFMVLHAQRDVLVLELAFTVDIPEVKRLILRIEELDAELGQIVMGHSE